MAHSHKTMFFQQQDQDLVQPVHHLRLQLTVTVIATAIVMSMVTAMAIVMSMGMDTKQKH